MNLPDDIKLEMNPKTKWELIKLKVKNLSISYCKEKSKNMKRKIQFIESELEQIEHQHHLNINMIRKKELENELEALYKIKSEGAQIRSRAKWIDEGEKNSSYFLRLENKHQSKNVINKVSNAGSTFVKTNDILNELCKFYENLYSSKDI